MANKFVSTRIKNKVDTLAKWNSFSDTLLDGEIAIVRVPTGETDINPVTGKTEPKSELLMKVGDGSKSFSELPWLSAKASDVYGWAKLQDPSAVTIRYNNGTDNSPVWVSATLAEVLEDLKTVEASVASKLSDITVTPTDQSSSGIVKKVEKGTTGQVVITRGTVESNDIAANAVTEGKIASEAVTNAKIKAGVSSDKISVSDKTLTAKIADMDSKILANTNASGHDHPYLSNQTKYAGSDAIGGAATSAKKVEQALSIQLNGGTATTFDGSAAKSINITPAAIGAASNEAVFGTNGLSATVAAQGGEIQNIKTAITNGVNFRGIVAAAPSESTTTVNGVTITAGDIVIYDGKEYICIGVTDGKPSWEQLGDVTRIGDLETKLNALDYGVINAVASTHNFVSQVTQEDGKIAVVYTRPSASDVAYSTNSDVNTKLNDLEANKATTNHTHDNYVNQNAFSKIAVSNQTSVEADSATDTITFEGSNVNITTDDTNDKVIFAVADANTNTAGVVKLSDATDGTAAAASGKTAATPKAVAAAYSLAAKAEADAANALETAQHNHPYLSNTTTYAKSDSVGGDALAAKKVINSLTVQLNGGSTEGTNKFTFDGSAVKSVNITPSTIGAATSGHTHVNYESNISSLSTNYVRFTKIDGKDAYNMHLGTDADVIIFDCGGAE